MRITLGRFEDIPLEQSRGIDTIDKNILFVMVRSPVQPVAQAFSTLRQMNVWVRDAYQSDINIQNETTLIFQFRGHPWSLIYKPNMPSMRMYLTEEDALELSKLVGTSAIYYAGSDTCGTIGYELCSNGICVEKLSFEENVSFEFQSQLRPIKAKDIRNAYTFTMNFIREQDAYVPCLFQLEDLTAGQHTTLDIENLMSNELERMDYLAKQ